jgi:hypothetical protein
VLSSADAAEALDECLPDVNLFDKWWLLPGLLQVWLHGQAHSYAA